VPWTSLTTWQRTNAFRIQSPKLQTASAIPMRVARNLG